uniref:Uncharacterized protein n=1 Tax=Timema bartmani TaxID=61472 RepID=A0A7R9FAC9_9NEOP|nr:unnamed protein product [Timema bartmani]
MSTERLTHRIFSYFQSKKTKRIWFTGVEKDLKEVGITGEDIQERGPLKNKLREYRGLITWDFLMDSVLLQKQVRDNADELQSYLKDLKSWGDEMKRKESELQGDSASSKVTAP